MAAPDPDNKPAGIEFYGGYQVYSESGVDLALLRSNLKRSIEERWESNRRAAAFGLALQQSGQAARGLIPPIDWKQWNPTMTDPSALVNLLTMHSVQFVIVGGQAMVAHGSVHITLDLDICYQRTPANLAALVAALAPIHPYLRGAPPGLPFRFDVPTLAAGLNFTLDTDHGPLDLLGEVSGVGIYDQVLAQSVERTIFDHTVRVLSVDGLIAAKKAAGRNKDHTHLSELIELKKMLEAGGENA
jgi:hypothetical protein